MAIAIEKESSIATPPAANNLLRVIAILLICFSIFTEVLGIAMMPEFYRLAVSGSLPTITVQGVTQLSNETVAQEAAARSMPVPAYVRYRMTLDLIYTLAFFAVAILIALRARGNWFLWFTAWVLIFIPGGSLFTYYQINPFWSKALVFGSIFWPAFPLFLYLFPNGKAVPGWIRWFLWPILLLHLLFQADAALATVTGSAPIPYPVANQYAWVAIFSFPLAIFSQVYRYMRVSTQIERLQTKWVVTGLVATLLGDFVMAIFFRNTFLTADNGFASDAANLFMLFIPLSIGVSILRYRLYDIDIIIRRTLVYALLTGLLGLAYFGSVVALQQVFSGSLASSSLPGEGSPVAIVLSTLLIAAIFHPMRKRLQHFIDRRFFRRKYDTETVLAGFRSRLRGLASPETLKQDLLSVVKDTLEPDSVDLWVKRQ